MSHIKHFSQDDEGHWLAVLECGHTQHVRHRPPWEVRPWVVSEQGRNEQIGTELPCPLCRMPTLPDGLSEYLRTDTFTHETVPKGLLRSHQLKPNVWGEIVVTSGHVVYVIEDEPPQSFPLNERVTGTVAPEQPHHVIVRAGSTFYVRFLRAAET